MSIRRVVPDFGTKDVEATRTFYTDVLGFDVGMEMGWIVTFVSPSTSTAQITFLPGQDPSGSAPQVTVEVEDVVAAHALAVEAGAPIVYPLTDEPWGARRFFVEDPNGIVINVMSHVPVRPTRRR